MSSTVATNSGLTEQDLNERIDVGIAFLVLLFMAGLGAYLMMDGNSEGSGSAFLAADNTAQDTSRQSVVASPVESVIEEDDSRERRQTEQTEPVASIEQAAPAEVMQPMEPVEIAEPVQALQAEPRPFQPVEVAPTVVEPEVEPEVIPEETQVAEVEPVAAEPLPAEPEPAAEISEDELAILQDATSNVSFLTASAVLTKESNAVLDNIAELMSTRSDTRLSIIGFTDSQGDSDRNVALSFARAEACRDYLLQRGIEIGRVDSVGMGSRRPIGDNSTPEGRKLNRRVEFTLLKGG